MGLLIMDIFNIKKGDVINLKPEWMDPGDENIKFVAAEDHNGGETIYISDANCKMHIVPTHLVYNHMIKGF